VTGSTTTPQGLVTSPGGHVVYVPNPDYFGNDSFTFVTSDCTSRSSVGTVNLVVPPANDPPAPGTVEFLVGSGLSALLPLWGTDPDNDTITAYVVDPPVTGKLFQVNEDLTQGAPITRPEVPAGEAPPAVLEAVTGPNGTVMYVAR